MEKNEVKFLNLHSQYLEMKEDIDSAINRVITNSSYIGGKEVKDFETSFASFLNVRGCLGVGNGTDALEIALEALNLPKGSEVLVPANSFIASSEAISRAGLTVKFCDVNEFGVISNEEIEKKHSSNVSAIMPVHLYGHPCDMDFILNFAKKNNLKVIEDSAQAHGARYNDRLCGSMGDISTFSFYPGKNLGAYGDAGAICSNDEQLLEKARKIANHGRVQKYNHEFEGRNSRLDGLQAAILNEKLKRLPNWIEKRNEVAKYYRNHLRNEKIEILPISDNVYHAYHLFVVKLSNRDSLKEYLKNENIQSGIHYPISLNQLPAYKHLGQIEDFPVSQKNAETVLSLPIGEHLTEDELKRVCDVVNSF